jgi:hypothetical protein
VTLLDVKPPIWRRLLIPADLFLHDFHKVLQTAMGWENQHLHYFRKGERLFGIADDEWSDNKRFQDYTTVRVVDLLRNAGAEMEYHYDMGDHWRHRIVMEKELEPDPIEYYPLCAGGARGCPPENCGGAHGYMEMVSAVRNPASSQHRFFKAMLPQGFDPEYFDVEEINDFLLEDDYGCFLSFEDD